MIPEPFKWWHHPYMYPAEVRGWWREKVRRRCRSCAVPHVYGAHKLDCPLRRKRT